MHHACNEVTPQRGMRDVHVRICMHEASTLIMRFPIACGEAWSIIDKSTRGVRVAVLYPRARRERERGRLGVY